MNYHIENNVVKGVGDLYTDLPRHFLFWANGEIKIDAGDGGVYKKITPEELNSCIDNFRKVANILSEINKEIKIRNTCNELNLVAGHIYDIEMVAGMESPRYDKPCASVYYKKGQKYRGVFINNDECYARFWMDKPVMPNGDCERFYLPHIKILAAGKE